MNPSIFLSQIYEHVICSGPSNHLFSALRYAHYARHLKHSGGPFISSTGFCIQCPENVSIGKDTYFNRNVFLACVNVPESEIVIGNHCLFGPNCVIVAGGHDVRNAAIRTRAKDSIPGRIIIEDDCWIGANTTIRKDVCIGRGSVIGANSVATHDLPAYVVAAGTPARVIRERKQDVSVLCVR